MWRMRNVWPVNCLSCALSNTNGQAWLWYFCSRALSNTNCWNDFNILVCFICFCLTLSLSLSSFLPQFIALLLHANSQEWQESCFGLLLSWSSLCVLFSFNYCNCLCFVAAAAACCPLPACLCHINWLVWLNNDYWFLWLFDLCCI